MNLQQILQNALNAVRGAFQPQQKELISPIPKEDMVGFGGQTTEQAPQPTPTPSPSPTPMPQIQPRNPNWEHWQQVNPKGFQELLSGAQLASERHGVPADMLMDVSGLETSGGTQLGSPAGHTAAGYFMFNDPTLNDPYLPADVPADFDKNSATASADLAAQLIKKKQLGRWAVAKGKGAGGNSLGDFYSPEELAPYLR